MANIKIDWKEKKDEPNIVRYIGKYKDYTLTAVEEQNEKQPRCWWFIATPKAPFNLSSKKVLFNIGRCKQQCEVVFNQLMSD